MRCCSHSLECGHGGREWRKPLHPTTMKSAHSCIRQPEKWRLRPPASSDCAALLQSDENLYSICGMHGFAIHSKCRRPPSYGVRQQARTVLYHLQVFPVCAVKNRQIRDCTSTCRFSRFTLNVYLLTRVGRAGRARAAQVPGQNAVLEKSCQQSCQKCLMAVKSSCCERHHPGRQPGRSLTRQTVHSTVMRLSESTKKGGITVLCNAPDRLCYASASWHRQNTYIWQTCFLLVASLLVRQGWTAVLSRCHRPGQLKLLHRLAGCLASHAHVRPARRQQPLRRRALHRILHEQPDGTDQLTVQPQCQSFRTLHSREVGAQMGSDVGQQIRDCTGSKQVGLL